MNLGIDCLRTTPGEVVHQLAEVLTKQEHFEKVMARVRQQRIASDLGRNRRAMTGLGRPRLEVDNFSYHYWGQRLGYKCWKDPQFLREFERDNPECRVQSRGAKDLQVGYGTCAPKVSGLACGESTVRNRRFKKSFG